MCLRDERLMATCVECGTENDGQWHSSDQSVVEQRSTDGTWRNENNKVTQTDRRAAAAAAARLCDH